MALARIKTPLGIATLQASEKGISKISISQEEDNVSGEVPEELEEAARQLREYFSGERTSFDLELAPEGTDFQKKVWLHLRNIPFGKTHSYLSLAKEIGDVKAIRAVASANAKNPLWVVIPCHRVIGRDGSLTGYAGGLWRKKWLLEHENILKQTSLF